MRACGSVCALQVRHRRVSRGDILREDREERERRADQKRERAALPSYFPDHLAGEEQGSFTKYAEYEGERKKRPSLDLVGRVRHPSIDPVSVAAAVDPLFFASDNSQTTERLKQEKIEQNRVKSVARVEAAKLVAKAPTKGLLATVIWVVNPKRGTDLGAYPYDPSGWSLSHSKLFQPYDPAGIQTPPRSPMSPGRTSGVMSPNTGRSKASVNSHNSSLLIDVPAQNFGAIESVDKFFKAPRVASTGAHTPQHMAKVQGRSFTDSGMTSGRTGFLLDSPPPPTPSTMRSQAMGAFQWMTGMGGKGGAGGPATRV